MSDRHTLQSAYRTAVIGCGSIGFLYDHDRTVGGAYTHVRAFRQSPAFDVVAAAEPDAAVRSLLEQQGIAAYADYRTMLREVAPEVVSIAAPDHLHTELLDACCEARPRAVFCEKPLAASRQEAERIVARYRDAGIGLQVNFTRRFLPEYRQVGQWIRDGVLGALQHVSIYYSRGLVHNGSHYIDALLHLLGEPEQIGVMRTRPGLTADDPTVGMVWNYGAFDVVFAGMLTGSLLTNEIDIVGTDGRVEINTDGEVVRSAVQRHPFYERYTRFEPVERVRIAAGQALPCAVDNLYGYLQGTEDLLSPGANSIRIFRIIDCIQEQCYGGTGIIRRPADDSRAVPSV